MLETRRPTPSKPSWRGRARLVHAARPHYGGPGMSATTSSGRPRALMGGPCIECGERADVSEHLPVELAQHAMDLLCEPPAPLRRWAKRDYLPLDNWRSVRILCFGTYAARMEE